MYVTWWGLLQIRFSAPVMVNMAVLEIAGINQIMLIRTFQYYFLYFEYLCANFFQNTFTHILLIMEINVDGIINMHHTHFKESHREQIKQYKLHKIHIGSFSLKTAVTEYMF